MAGEADPVALALPLASELAGADVQDATGSTAASAPASANAGADLSGRHHGRAQGFRYATKAENTQVNRPPAPPGYAGGPRVRVGFPAWQLPLPPMRYRNCRPSSTRSRPEST